MRLKGRSSARYSTGIARVANVREAGFCISQRSYRTIFQNLDTGRSRFAAEVKRIDGEDQTGQTAIAVAKVGTTTGHQRATAVDRARIVRGEHKGHAITRQPRIRRHEEIEGDRERLIEIQGDRGRREGRASLSADSWRCQPQVAVGKAVAWRLVEYDGVAVQIPSGEVDEIARAGTIKDRALRIRWYGRQPRAGSGGPENQHALVLGSRTFQAGARRCHVAPHVRGAGGLGA